MPLELTRNNVNNNLPDELLKMHEWYNSELESISSISSTKNFCTVKDFYNDFIEPILPDTCSVKKWTELLLEYVKHEDAVFAIRNYSSWNKVSDPKPDPVTNKDGCLAVNNGKKVGDNNPYVLRRGFLTEIEGAKYKYFFTDNFFAAYFMKMAYDGFVPSIDEFKRSMQKCEFPARFGRSCKEERVIAAYDITGRKAKDPGIQKKGYKIGHVIDSGKDYQGMNISCICDQFFPRGNYEDWEKTGDIYSRVTPDMGGLAYLKAHFLRFACPINYFLAPKANLRVEHQSYGSKSSFTTNKPDIAELSELQQYVIGRFSELYDETYIKFLKAVMWKSDVEKELNTIKNKKLGETIIDLNVL